LRYISRSSFDAFRECPRKGFWRYLSGPFGEDSTLGLEEATGMNQHYALGIVWHSGAEVLLKGGTGQEAYSAAAAVAEVFPLEPYWHNWLLAAFLAWERAKREDFFTQWEVLSVEEEFEIPISPNVVLYTRADAVVRSRSDGSCWVLNWKTASDVKDWTKKWFFDPQGWTEALAAESRLGVEISGCIYLGVWKGPMYNGKSTSRLMGGYKHHSKTGVTYGTENGGGGVKFDAARESFPFGEGIAAWVSWLPLDFLAKHFVESAPQLRQDALVEKWLKQLVKQEDAIDYVLDSGSPEDVETFFWQNWSDDCGRCSFKDLCLLRSTPEELLKDGFLRPRRRSPRDEAEEAAAAAREGK
jgi:hypothetical protein